MREILAEHLAEGLEELIHVQAAAAVDVSAVERRLQLHELMQADPVLDAAGLVLPSFLLLPSLFGFGGNPALEACRSAREHAQQNERCFLHAGGGTRNPWQCSGDQGNPANRGTETSAEDLVGPPGRMVSERRSTAEVRLRGWKAGPSTP